MPGPPDPNAPGPHGGNDPGPASREAPGLAGLRRDDLGGEDRARGLPALAGLRWHTVTGADDPWFGRAFAVLDSEFGALGELEPRAVLAERLARGTAESRSGWCCRYALLVLHRDGGDEPLAVRDHTAIVAEPQARDIPGPVVHLSHAWVSPAVRGRGLGAWLRALPITTARAMPGVRIDAPVTLVAEMEHPGVPATAAQVQRLRAYERAGFAMLDPRRVRYVQPDFRDAPALAGDGPGALPLRLLLRRVGEPEGGAMAASGVSGIITALYRMYALDLAPAAMAQAWEHLAAMGLGDADVPLLAPTAGCGTTAFP